MTLGTKMTRNVTNTMTRFEAGAAIPPPLHGGGQRFEPAAVHPDSLTHAFDRETRKLGFDIRFHDLRHTHATILLRRGVHPKIVQERLGHATIAVTLDTYSHVLPDMQQAAVSALDAVFGA